MALAPPSWLKASPDQAPPGLLIQWPASSHGSTVGGSSTSQAPADPAGAAGLRDLPGHHDYLAQLWHTRQSTSSAHCPSGDPSGRPRRATELAASDPGAVWPWERLPRDSGPADPWGVTVTWSGTPLMPPGGSRIGCSPPPCGGLREGGCSHLGPCTPARPCRRPLSPVPSRRRPGTGSLLVGAAWTGRRAQASGLPRRGGLSLCAGAGTRCPPWPIPRAPGLV